jgi:hypothetical protein
MKIKLSLFYLSICICIFTETRTKFKKRVLENIEVDFLASYYDQDGQDQPYLEDLDQKKLSDVASNIIVYAFE